MLAQEAREARRGAQLVDPRTLPASRAQGVAERRFDGGRIVTFSREDLGAEPKHVGARCLFAGYGALGFGEGLERVGDIARPGLQIGEECQVLREE